MKKNKLVVSNYKCEKTNLIFRGRKNEFTTGCRYIEGDPKGIWYQCGNPTHGKSSWCIKHFDVVSDLRADKRIRIPGYAKRS